MRRPLRRISVEEFSREADARSGRITVALVDIFRAKCFHLAWAEDGPGKSFCGKLLDQTMQEWDVSFSRKDGLDVKCIALNRNVCLSCLNAIEVYMGR